MSDQKMEKPPTVGEMDQAEFFNVLMQILDRRKETGDAKLLDMTVKEFTTSMLETLKGKAYATAQAEYDTATRVLTDWQGLQAVEAVSQPFRIASKVDLDKFHAELSRSYSPNGGPIFVVAVAIVSSNGYQRVT